MYSLSHYYIINRIPYVAGCRYLGPILCEIKTRIENGKRHFFIWIFLSEKMLSSVAVATTDDCCTRLLPRAHLAAA